VIRKSRIGTEADAKLRELIKEQNEKSKVQLEDFLRKRLQVEVKELPAQGKALELFTGVIRPSVMRVFPAELTEGPSITPEAKKRRIEEELKRAKARVEQLEEELKKSEAK